MNANKLTPAIEAILFASGEPLSIKRISEVLEVEIELIEQVILNLSAQLDERGSGLCIIKMDDKYQLCTRTEFSDEVRSVLEIKKNTPLSQAAFEVLAVIAYNQPVTKSFVEQVRGVDCSGVIATLCQKGLVEEKGRLDLPGKPLIYGTTPVFLRCFGLSSLSDLPEIPKTGSDDKVDGNIPANKLDSTTQKEELHNVVLQG